MYKIPTQKIVFKTYFLYLFLFSGSRVDCPVCGKLLHPRALKRHVEDVHQAQPGKPYHCDHCGKMFGNEQYLRNHQRTTHGIYVSKY